MSLFRVWYAGFLYFNIRCCLPGAERTDAFPAFPIGCSQSHIATATAAKAVSQARFVGEVKTFIRLIDKAQSLFVQNLASCSRYIRWLNKRYYLPL